MCMQCMAGASAAMGGAATTRAWLATRTWMTPLALRRATVALLGAAVLGSASLVSSSTPPPAQPAATQTP